MFFLNYLFYEMFHELLFHSGHVDACMLSRLDNEHEWLFFNALLQHRRVISQTSILISKSESLNAVIYKIKHAPKYFRAFKC